MTSQATPTSETMQKLLFFVPKPSASDVSRAAREARTIESARLGHDIGWDHAWTDENCIGDGWDRHPLLAGPGHFIAEKSVSMSGEIRDGRGHHPMASFSWEPAEPS